MTRLACLLGLVAMAMAILLDVRTTGPSAIWFVFAGMPALGVALLLYAAIRWRARAPAPAMPARDALGHAETDVRSASR
jgi:hypothetical protein